MEVYDRYVTMNGTMSVSSYKKKSHKPEEDRIVNMQALLITDRGTVEEKTIERWLMENDTIIQNRVGESDEYAEIDIITELDIYFKYVPSGGSGFVTLKNPELFPEVFCPELQKFCYQAIMDHNELPFKEGVTLHKVANELNITNGFVPVHKIKEYLGYLANSVRIVLHNVKDDKFVTKFSDCSRIKADGCPVNAKDLHIGHIMNHYFSVTNPKVLDRLNVDDFACVSSENEHLLKTLDTSNPVAVFDWKLKRRSREKIEDEEIKQ